MAFREKGEYYVENRTVIMQRNKQRYEANRDEIIHKMQEHYHGHKEEIKPRRKQYNIEHREHKAEYDQEVRERNRERIKQRKGLQEICECGITYTHDHKSRHLRTKKHQEWLKTQST